MFRQPSWHCLAMIFATFLFAAFARADDPAAPAPDKDAGRQAIQNALTKKIDWNFNETPLAEVAEKLHEELKIPVLLDRRALNDLGVTPETAVSFKISGILAKSALRLLLSELGLTTMIRNEVLLITSPDIADNHLLTITYDVTDLVVVAEGEEPDFDSLIDMITKTIKPTTWDGVGGTGSVQPYQSVGITAIVVSQTEDVHEQLAQVLADLRALRRPVKEPKTKDAAQNAAPLEKHAPLELSQTEKASRLTEKIIRASLKKSITLDFVEEPLLDAIAFLEKETAQTFHVDKRGIGIVETAGMFVEQKRLTAEDVDKQLNETKITLHLTNVELETALDAILRDTDLAWTVRDESICITSQDEADSIFFVRTYDVSDLPAYRAENGEAIPDFDNLLETITKTIRPTSWDGVGGTGSVQPVNTGGIQALVVSQTWQIQEQVAELLDNLRKLRRTPLTNEELAKLPPLPSRPLSHSVPFDTVKPLPPLDPDPARDAIAQVNNRFSIDLYAQLREKDRKNLVVSPYSLSTALAMAYAGARGETADEMAKTLHFSLSQEETPHAYRSLFDAILPENETTGQLLIANRLWCQSNFRYRQHFLDACRNQFSSEIGQVDFEKNPDSVRNDINAWVEAKTQHRIKDLFEKGSVDRTWRLAITNAVYFKDFWQDKFDKRLTRADSFQSEAGEIRVQMMNQQEFCGYADAEDAQILEKPYRDGRLAMTFVLPKKNSVPFGGFESSLSDEKLQEWISKLHTKTVNIYLPRFHIDGQFDLGNTLQTMGMKKAFSQADADFSGMHEEPAWKLWIAMVVQKAFVEVDEEGTEAAAASGIGMGGFGGMGPVPKIPVFRADHPFLFLIRDTRTGCILFLGRVMVPPNSDA